MDLPIITVDPAVAQQALDDYRAAVQEQGKKEIREKGIWIDKRRAEIEAADRQILEGYKIIATGKPIISLRAALASGGWDEHGRPKLAVARADERTVRVQTWANGRVDFDPKDPSWGHWDEYARSNSNRRFSFLSLLPPRERPSGSVTAESVVPHIPPRLRPVALERYDILFEATWTSVPVDPALIRQVRGDLYVVVATWDLTELERAALA